MDVLYVQEGSEQYRNTVGQVLKIMEDEGMQIYNTNPSSVFYKGSIPPYQRTVSIFFNPPDGVGQYILTTDIKAGHTVIRRQDTSHLGQRFEQIGRIDDLGHKVQITWNTNDIVGKILQNHLP